MKILLIAIAISILFWGFSLPWFIRTYARTRADQIIRGKRSGTEKHITKCIRVLTWTNKWITAREELDNQRIIRLRDMLNEMQHPHG